MLRWRVSSRLQSQLAASVVLVLGTLPGIASLSDYDIAIADDAAGGLAPAAKLTAPVTFNGTTFIPSILDLFPERRRANSSSKERQLGRTGTSLSEQIQRAVCVSSNGMTPGRSVSHKVVSPITSSHRVCQPAAQARHIVYIWDGAGTMRLYVDGTLASTRGGVAGAFAMPAGNGRLGANPSGGEAMTGTVHRVTTYGFPISGPTIQRHAEAFLGIARPPSILEFKAMPAFVEPNG